MSLTWYEMLLRSRTFSLGICRDRYTYLDGVIMYEKIKPDLNVSPNYKWPTLNSQWHLEATFIRLFDQVSLLHLLNASHPLKIMSVVAVVVLLWWCGGGHHSLCCWWCCAVEKCIKVARCKVNFLPLSWPAWCLLQCRGWGWHGEARALTEPRQRAV